jgi:ribosomal protein S18
LEYNQISDIFYQNDFNRNVTPSNHETREFGIVKQRVANILKKNTLIFDYEKDNESLKSFIKSEFKEQGI